jgi:hypothetical protein
MLKKQTLFIALFSALMVQNVFAPPKKENTENLIQQQQQIQGPQQQQQIQEPQQLKPTYFSNKNFQKEISTDYSKKMGEYLNKCDELYRNSNVFEIQTQEVNHQYTIEYQLKDKNNNYKICRADNPFGLQYQPIIDLVWGISKKPTNSSIEKFCEHICDPTSDSYAMAQNEFGENFVLLQTICRHFFVDKNYLMFHPDTMACAVASIANHDETCGKYLNNMPLQIFVGWIINPPAKDQKILNTMMQGDDIQKIQKNIENQNQ